MKEREMMNKRTTNKRTACILLTLAAMSVSAVQVEFAQGDRAVQFAAGELKRLLGGATGVIALREDPQLSAQAWRFKSDSGGKLVISGRDGMGIAYGVFTFLEKYVGVRWFAPDTECVPDLTGWTLPADLDETGKPVFNYREMYVGHDFMDGTWRLRNKETNRAGYSCNVGNGSPFDCHTFMIYGKSLREKHPELFTGRVNAAGNACTEMCMTDERTRELVAEEMCGYIEKDAARCAGKPLYVYPSVYDLSQPDGGSGMECMCPGCRKLFEESGSYAGPNIAFVSAVAERVARRHPEVTIQTFAYSYTREPPTNGIVAARNVNVRYCCSWVFDPLVKGSPQGDRLEKWAKHSSQMGLWSYWRTYRGMLFPFVKKRTEIAEELRFCRDQGVNRYYAENEAPLSRSFAMMQHWLLLKMTEDPSRDVFALSKEFLRGYYGAAAEVMERYLDYLERRQKSGVGCLDTPQRQHLDREFFEKVNGWLDEAEKLVADDPRSLLHVHWERVVVDRSMYDVLGELKKQGFTCNFEDVARRFLANAVEQLETWSELQTAKRRAMKAKRIEDVKGEAKLYRHYPVPLPEKFKGLDVETVEWINLTPSGAAVVDDPDAAAGSAFYDPKYDYKLPFSLGYYNPVLKESGSEFFKSKDDVPQDEKYHLYPLGEAVIMSPLYFHWSDWNFRRYMGTLGIVPEKRSIWVSMKFQGPAFVSGSVRENRVLVDRVFYVKGDDLTGGLVKSGGNLVPESKRTMEVSGVAGNYRALWASLGDPEKIKGGLLVRGKMTCRGVSDKPALPFIGLWAVKYPGGKNDFTVRCAEMFKGDCENRAFSAYIPPERLRRHVRRADGKLDLTFRINIVGQTSSVRVSDLEIYEMVPADESDKTLK